MRRFSDSNRRNRRPFWRRVTAAAVLLLAAIGLVWWLWRPRPAVEEIAPSGVPPEPGGNAALPGEFSSAALPANAAAPRLRFCRFEIDRSGIRLGAASMALGRAKALPVSSARERLEFEVLDARGEAVETGSLDHPLRPRFEFEDEHEPGRLRQVIPRLAANEFVLRLPVEMPVQRIRFFEVVIDPATNQAERRVLGEVSLP